MHGERRRSTGEAHARIRLHRHVARVGEDAPFSSKAEFEAAVDDDAGRILEADSSRTSADLSIDIPQYRVDNAGAHIRSYRATLQEMPLKNARDRIKLRPAEVRGANEIASDDAHADFRSEAGDLRPERDAVAQKEVQPTAHTAAGVELRLEASDARSETECRAAPPHSFGIEKDLHSPLRSGGGGQRQKGGGNAKRLHVVTVQQEACGIR